MNSDYIDSLCAQARARLAVGDLVLAKQYIAEAAALYVAAWSPQATPAPPVVKERPSEPPHQKRTQEPLRPRTERRTFDKKKHAAELARQREALAREYRARRMVVAGPVEPPPSYVHQYFERSELPPSVFRAALVSQARHWEEEAVESIAAVPHRYWCEAERFQAHTV